MRMTHFVCTWLVLITALCWDYPHGGASEPGQPDNRMAEIRKTKTGVRYGIWPEQPTQPAPILFIFGASIEETLNAPYFRQSGNQLAKSGYLCVSVDLPGHGNAHRAGEPAGIEAWRYRCDQEENFVEQATADFRVVLDDLIETRLADPSRIAVCGTSRGGFMAAQFAAADERVKCVATYAPVTDLMALREFQGVKHPEKARQLSLKAVADKLAGRAIWLIIGDRDDRVSTDESIAFCRAVTAASLKRNRSAMVDLHVVVEPQGHTTPAGAADLAAVWIAKQLGTMK